jgi:peptide/nickel transport system substrate-binding protein
MQLRRKLGLAMTLGAVAATMSLGLVAPTVSGAAPTGTITFAEGPGANPNYIFPYMGCQFFSVDNINQFQQMMFRPLYFFGLGGSPAVQYKLSLAPAPSMSHGDTTATLHLRNWKFADGQTVNARSIMFFLNMLQADPTAYCGDNGPFSIPALIKSASGKGQTVTINFTRSMNPLWLVYNNLSFITAFPDTWDRTASGRANCATGKYGASSTAVACKNVEAFLDAQSANSSTYTNAMWQSGVDGPWRLKSYDNLGNLTMVPNQRYSGPVHAKVAQVKEVAYTSTQAEENDLQAGKIDLGFVDPGVLTGNAISPTKAGPNWGQLASRYNMVVGSVWNFNYAPFNFSSADPKSAAIAQLYIRQALQESVDQTGIIGNVDKGYGIPIDSPLPPTTPSSLSGKITNPYPFSLTNAKALLTSHGWTIQGGVQTCTNPGTGSGQCGAGIGQGYTLNFNIVWASGSPALDQTFNAEVADWASIGIQFAHTEATFNNVIADCSGGSGFEVCSWGGGWTYAPDFEPTGESLFAPTGGFNVGGYNDATMTADITATDFGTAKLTAYGNYAAAQLPVLYQPQAFAPGETIKTLHSSIGFVPNPLGNFMPEYLYY